MLYFNAWEADQEEDPLVAILAQYEAHLRDLRELSKLDDALERKLKSLKTAAVDLVRYSLPVAIASAVQASMVGLTGGAPSPAAAVTTQSLAHAAGKVVEDRLERLGSRDEAVAAFKDALTSLIAKVRGKDDTAPPIIFAIDELDRCLPEYAIKVLERVKHLFSVPGVVFVLALDRDQLREAVRSRFGAGIAVEGYLRRFVDFEYILPRPESRPYLTKMIVGLGVDKYFRYSGAIDRMRETFPDVADAFGLEIRGQEQVFAHLAVILRIGDSLVEDSTSLLSFLLLLRAAKRDVYLRLCEKSIPVGELVTTVTSSDHTFFQSNNWTEILSACAGHLHGERAKAELARIMDMQSGASVTVGALPGLDVRGDMAASSRELVGFLVKRIDLAEGFGGL
jgi:hypothetical protein